MSLIKRLAALMIPIALAILIGCGGGGSSPTGGSSPNALTRQNVKEGFGLSLMALAQSGMGPTGAGGGTTGGTNGGGGGVPFVGAFVHSFLPGPGGPLARVKATRGDVSTGGSSGTTGTTTSGGGDETPEIYFDEYLGLWVEWSWSGDEYSTKLYEDEAKTQPAGSFTTNYTDHSFTSVFEITAGQFKGAHGRYVSNYTDENGFASETTYDNTWPGYGHDEGTATWSESGSQWHHRSDLEGGAWYESDGSFTANGAGHSSGADSRGYRYNFTYNPDGSGSGRVEGPENGLPCTITWRADGFTRIVWADGSVEEFDPNDWIGGTTGSGTGTGGDANGGTVTGTGTVSGTSGSAEG